MSRPVDFFIIGAMKSATTTLYQQLAAQPGIFLCNPKRTLPTRNAMRTFNRMFAIRFNMITDYLVNFFLMVNYDGLFVDIFLHPEINIKRPGTKT